VATNEDATGPFEPLGTGKFGQALDARVARAVVEGAEAFRRPPITVECWAKIHSKSGFQILVANETKGSPSHWEMFTFAGTGHFTVYMPGMQPDHIQSETDITDGAWHQLAMIYEPSRVRLFVDGKQVADQPIKIGERPADKSDVGQLAIGSLVERSIGCDGLIDELRISRGVKDVSGPGTVPRSPADDSIGLWRFDVVSNQQHFPDESPRKASARVEAVKKK
jgi:hypothetical protein